MPTCVYARPDPPGALEQLVDRFGRVHDYARIAVNRQCNLRCVYCRPIANPAVCDRGSELSTDEVLGLVSVLARLGVSRVRFTGGEPLLRTDLPRLVAGAGATEGVRAVHVTTNGLLLAERGPALRAAGLAGLNLSLDTLRADRFAAIARPPAPERDRTGPALRERLRIALDLGIPSIKVNMVVMRGINDDEIVPFVHLAREAPITVRFIELMPFDAGQLWGRGRLLEARQIVARLARAFPRLRPVAGTPTEHHAFRIPGYRGKVAVIPAYTRSFCRQCRRIRITADGQVLNCLYSTAALDVKRPLRAGAPAEVVASVFRRALAAKKRNGREARRAGGGPGPGALRTDTAHPETRRSMTLIGG